MQSDFLTQMLQKTQERLAKKADSRLDFDRVMQTARVPHDFISQFQAHHMPRVIAEIKFKSPALGHIASGDPVVIAKQYDKAGAAAISVLTEPHYFHGSINYLQQVRLALPEALLLMKDFILDESQLLQARLYGADAVLLIVAFIDRDVLHDLYSKAVLLGLTPLVEVHTLQELRIAEALGARLIGVNNRNLQTLQVDLKTSYQVIHQAKKKSLLISESGIQKPEEIALLQKEGYQGFLIGGQLMQHAHPGEALRDLLYES